MGHRCFASLGTLAIVWLTAVPVTGQVQTAAGKATKAKTWMPPRTPDGQPDLQGMWTNFTGTPLERPSDLAGKRVYTDEELAAQEAVEKARYERTNNRPPPPRPGEVGAGGGIGLNDRKRPTKHTSLVIDPPDGRIPLTEEAQRRPDAPGARSGWTWDYKANERFDSWTDLHLWERCITRGLPGAMLPPFYNDNYQILQTPGYVMILIEMIHDARIIPLDGRPHLSQSVRQWLGDARGHWEGTTLVVETTNFTNKVTDRTRYVFGAGETSRLVERFTRVDADTINYEFTFEDPKTFTRPWTAAIPLTQIHTPIYEYGCHEGNYGLQGILAGARAQDKTADEAAKGRSR